MGLMDSVKGKVTDAMNDPKNKERMEDVKQDAKDRLGNVEKDMKDRIAGDKKADSTENNI